MNNAQVAHKWAACHGREGSAKGSNFYFNGATLYSYGPHYPLAAFTNVTTKSGLVIVLENSRGYSMTTAKHHGHMHNALRGLNCRVIRVPNVEDSPLRSQHVENLAHMESNFLTCVTLASKARKNVDHHVKRAFDAQTDAIDYAHAFGLECPAWAHEELSADLLTKARETAKREAAERAAKAKERERLRAMDYAEKIEAWRNGADANMCELWRFAGEPTELRLSADGKRVQTSRGAEVSKREAERLFFIVQAARGQDDDTRALYVSRMPEISGFTVRGIAANGDITIGCHLLTWNVVNAFGTSQGW